MSNKNYDARPPGMPPTIPQMNSMSIESNTYTSAPLNYPPYQHSYQQASVQSPTGHSPLDRPSSITPSEEAEMNRPFVEPGWWKKPRNIMIVAILGITAILVILFGIFHKDVDRWLQPLTNWLRPKKWGWLIPVAILLVVSFPPLFGHEIVGLLCGDVYGLWIGFAVMAGGTLLGEVANYFVFKYFCSVRGGKYEKKSFFYACLARAIREGGFVMALMARLSVVPSHFTTTVFATCGMGFWIFLLASICSLPKQFSAVAVGVLVNNTDKTTHIISIALLTISSVATFVSYRYIRRKTKEQRIWVIRERKVASRLQST